MEEEGCAVPWKERTRAFTVFPSATPSMILKLPWPHNFESQGVTLSSPFLPGTTSSRPTETKPPGGVTEQLPSYLWLVLKCAVGETSLHHFVRPRTCPVPLEVSLHLDEHSWTSNQLAPESTVAHLGAGQTIAFSCGLCFRQLRNCASMVYHTPGELEHGYTHCTRWLALARYEPNIHSTLL